MAAADPPGGGPLGDDDTLLRALGQALRTEPDGVDEEPPADVVELAKAAWGPGELDWELAALLLDSTHDPMLSGMRGDVAAELRSLVFEGSAIRIELELSAGTGELLGQLEPAAQASVDLHTAAGTRTTVTDALGRFRFDLPPGGLRIRVRQPTAPDLLTPWITR